MGPGRTSGDPVDPVTTLEGASVFFNPDSWALRANQENPALVAHCSKN